jgi:hypothetical protein
MPGTGRHEAAACLTAQGEAGKSRSGVLDSPPSLELNDENAVISTPASRFELVAAKNPYLLNRLALSLSSKSVRDAGESRRVRAPAREHRDSEAPAASL